MTLSGSSNKKELAFTLFTHTATSFSLSRSLLFFLLLPAFLHFPPPPYSPGLVCFCCLL